MAVHHPSLDVGESLGAPAFETFDHGRRDVGCQNLRAEASRRKAEGAGAGRDVQSRSPGTEARSAEHLLRQGSGQLGCKLVVARRDFVPSSRTCSCVVIGSSFVANDHDDTGGKGAAASRSLTQVTAIRCGHL